MAVTYISASAIASTASGTSITVTLPSAIYRDLFVAAISVQNNATIGTPTGWSRLTQVTTGASFSTAYFVIVNIGTIANPAFSWTGAAAGAAIVYVFRGAATAPIIGNVSGSGGGTNPHTTAGFNSSGLGSLAVAIDSQLSATAQATTPSGWVQNSAVGDATSTTAFANWSEQLGAIASASGAISVTEAAVKWTQFQLEILAFQYVPAVPNVIWAG